MTTFIFSRICKNYCPPKLPENTRENESCQINLRNSSLDAVFCADSESVFCFRLKVLFESENRQIPPQIAMVPVKTIFLDKGKKRKKTRCILL